MRFSIACTAALLAGNAAAVPNPTFNLGQDIKNLVSSLWKPSAKHGPTLNYHDKCPFTFPKVKWIWKHVSHDINWPKGINGGQFINWKTFKANGVNLGGWLEKERTHDPIWWESVGGAAAGDEWTLCQTLGSKCGPIFEARYESFLNTTTIDDLARVGVNTLRIPTT